MSGQMSNINRISLTLVELRFFSEFRALRDFLEFLSTHFYFLSAGEKIAGIIYQPESLQGMRENLERILQFMASKKIRMHQITSREILEGNLKAVMRLILALAAHYKPQSVKHHDVSYEHLPDGKPTSADGKTDSSHMTGEIRFLSRSLH